MITIGEGIPTAYCIEANAHALARYAALCQQGLVPIVEPEVLMDADNDIETCYRATKRTLHKTFDELYHQRVDLEGILLKPNMVISGKGSPTQASAEEVAEWTIRCFRETVPAAVPGIVFLSGGQSDEQASENLNAINSLGPQPWVLSFVWAGAASAALKAWRGSADNVEAGQSFLRAPGAVQQRRRCGPLLRRHGGAGPLELRIVTGRAGRGRRSRRRGARLGRLRLEAAGVVGSRHLPDLLGLTGRSVVLRLPDVLAAHARVGPDQEDGARGDLADSVDDLQAALVREDGGGGAERGDRRLPEAVGARQIGLAG